MRKTVRRIAAITLISCLAAVAAPAASAAPPPVLFSTLAQDEVTTLRAEMTRYGVSPMTQDDLLAKLDAGIVWDSMSSGDVVRTKQTTRADGTVVVVDTFADGSFLATTIEAAAAPTRKPRVGSVVTPMAVNGCTRTNSGTWRVYRNCHVSASTGVIMMSFDADYRQNFGLAGDTSYVTASGISNAYNAAGQTVGGTFSDLGVNINRAAGAPGLPATARASMTASVLGTSQTVWLQLNVPIKTYTLAYSTFDF